MLEYGSTRRVCWMFEETVTVRILVHGTCFLPEPSELCATCCPSTRRHWRRQRVVAATSGRTSPYDRSLLRRLTLVEDLLS